MKKAAFAAFLLVSLFLKTFVTKNLVRSFGHPFDVEPFVLLHELDVKNVAFRETFQRLDTLETVHLVREILGFHKSQFAA